MVISFLFKLFGKDVDLYYRVSPNFLPTGGKHIYAYNMKFHADKLSSAHIYLRMKEGESWEGIPQELLVDCAQLTKANSIEGRFGPCF